MFKPATFGLLLTVESQPLCRPHPQALLPWFCRCLLPLSLEVESLPPVPAKVVPPPPAPAEVRLPPAVPAEVAPLPPVPAEVASPPPIPAEVVPPPPVPAEVCNVDSWINRVTIDSSKSVTLV
jgi:hypothetical protein